MANVNVLYIHVSYKGPVTNKDTKGYPIIVYFNDCINIWILYKFCDFTRTDIGIVFAELYIWHKSKMNIVYILTIMQESKADNAPSLYWHVIA